MLGRWIRLLEAERALGAGKLEEAIDLASHPSVRSHRRALRVRERAVEAILGRARERIEADRLSAAASDLRLARDAAPRDPRVRDLERSLRPRLRTVEGKARAVRDALDAAAKAEARGRRVEARDRLRAFEGSTSEVRARLAEIERAIREDEALVQEVTRACADGDGREAGLALARLRRQTPTHPMIDSLARAAEVAACLPELREAAERAASGDASAAIALLERRGVSVPALSATEEAETIRRHARGRRRRALLEHLGRGAFRNAAAEARRLAAAGALPEDAGLLGCARFAARAEERMDRGDLPGAILAATRASQAEGAPEAVARYRERLEREGGSGTGASGDFVRETEARALDRPWDGTLLENAIEILEAERAGGRGGPEAESALERLRALRDPSVRAGAARGALRGGDLAAAVRATREALVGLRGAGEVEAGEDYRMETVPALLETLAEGIRAGRGEAFAALEDGGLEELAVDLFAERLAGLRELRDARPRPARPTKDSRGQGKVLAFPGREKPQSGGFPQRFFLRVEEGGEYLALAADRVRIGHARETSNEIPLLARVSARHAEIVRRVDLHAGVVHEIRPVPGRAVSRNGRPLEGPEILADGDRIGLGEAFVFEFRIPHPESRSALLRLPAGVEVDGAAAILLLKPGLDGRLRIGAGRTSHAPGRRGSEAVDLFLDEEGTLRVRGRDPLLVDGEILEEETGALRAGQAVESGRLRFTVDPV